jgi:hypothetical protein
MDHGLKLHLALLPIAKRHHLFYQKYAPLPEYATTDELPTPAICFSLKIFFGLEPVELE